MFFFYSSHLHGVRSHPRHKNLMTKLTVNFKLITEQNKINKDFEISIINNNNTSKLSQAITGDRKSWHLHIIANDRRANHGHIFWSAEFQVYMHCRKCVERKKAHCGHCKETLAAGELIFSFQWLETATASCCFDIYSPNPRPIH